MQSIRLARSTAPLRGYRHHITRNLATTANPSLTGGNSTTTTASEHSASAVTSTKSQQSIVPLSNVEAQWEKLSKEDQITVHSQLETLQKKDWKVLSVDEKKAAYYVAFGPHGPRAPVSPPGQGLKVFLSTVGLVGVAGVISLVIQSFAPPPPKTLTKEWQEASNQRAIDQKMNPITGISSEGYKGKGFVTHK